MLFGFVVISYDVYVVVCVVDIHDVCCVYDVAVSFLVLCCIR